MILPGPWCFTQHAFSGCYVGLHWLHRPWVLSMARRVCATCDGLQREPIKLYTGWLVIITVHQGLNHKGWKHDGWLVNIGSDTNWFTGDYQDPKQGFFCGIVVFLIISVRFDYTFTICDYFNGISLPNTPISWICVGIMVYMKKRERTFGINCLSCQDLGIRPPVCTSPRQCEMLRGCQRHAIHVICFDP